MRLNLATDLKTRTGAPDKDARLKNCYVESKGPMNDPNNPPQTAVRKRPIAQGGIAVGIGTAQGGIGMNVNGVPYFFGFWSDVLYPYFSTGTTWSSSKAYVIGDMVTVNFVDYWALANNTNSNPVSNPSSWSPRYVPPLPIDQVIVGYINNITSIVGFVNTTSLGTFTLPPLSSGNQVTPTAVSGDGNTVVGYAVRGDGVKRAFKWTFSGGMVDLGTLGGTTSAANAVSYDGSVIVGISDNTGNTQQRGFVYSAGVMTDLGTLGGTYCSAYGVSRDGSVIVGMSSTAGGFGRAFRYSGGTMSSLGTLGGDGSIAYGISGDGLTIVGNSQTTLNANTHAFKWTSGGGMVDLGSFQVSDSSALGVSKDGSVIVGWGYKTVSGNLVQRAFQYTVSGGMVDIGTLGGTSSIANGVSSDGNTIVGWAYATGSTTTIAFKYTGGLMTRLITSSFNTSSTGIN